MDPGRAPIRLLIADRQSLFRQSVRLVLENEGELGVVADVGDVTRVAAAVERERPHVVLLAAWLETRDVVRTVAQIRQRVPTCQVLVISDDEDEDLLMGILEAGATGYLTKQSPIEELIRGVRSVHAGETVVPADMVGSLVNRFILRSRERDVALRRVARLTGREREVLVLLAQGCGNAAIADALVISPQTARTHVQNLIGKLGVHSRLEAAMFLTRSGIIDDLRDDPLVVKIADLDRSPVSTA
jgi:DNA-binding NarL/FixJ family response regulator